MRISINRIGIDKTQGRVGEEVIEPGIAAGVSMNNLVLDRAVQTDQKRPQGTTQRRRHMIERQRQRYPAAIDRANQEPGRQLPVNCQR